MIIDDFLLEPVFVGDAYPGVGNENDFEAVAFGNPIGFIFDGAGVGVN